MPNKWFAITGRVPGDDEDTLRIYEAATVQEAKAAFKRDLCEGCTAEEIRETDNRYGCEGGAYISQCVASATEIRVVL